MEKDAIIELLEDQYWHPLIHPTRVELETANLLNDILDDIISKIKESHAK